MFKMSCTQSRTCLQCGQILKSHHILLSDGSYIDQQCLNIIQKSLNGETEDEEMLLFYKYILALVIYCKKCNNLIDGQIYKTSSTQSQQRDHICSLCQPKRQIIKRPRQCSSCQKQIQIFGSIEIQGMILCNKCYAVQSQGYKPYKQLEQKPDLGVNNLNNYFSSPRKEEMGLFSKYASHKYLDRMKYQPLLKKQIYPMSMMKFGYRQQEIPMKKKKQKIQCSECQRKKEFQEFQFREENYNVCKICFMKNHSNKKVEKKNQKNTCGFGLDMLFMQEQLPQLIPIKTSYQNTKKQEQKIAKTQDNHVYNLKGCKICFNGQSSMMNLKCRHLMMCNLCFQDEKKRQGQNQKNVLSCPICKTSGKYVLYIEPIYI